MITKTNQCRIIILLCFVAYHNVVSMMQDHPNTENIEMNHPVLTNNGAPDWSNYDPDVGFDISGVPHAYHDAIISDTVHIVLTTLDYTNTTDAAIVIVFIVYCWIRVSRTGQITVIIIDDEG